MTSPTLPTADEIGDLFSNDDPVKAWDKTTRIIRRISPAYDASRAQTAFDDVIRLFHGEYPGYSAIKTLYHDLPHTLDVLLCAARLMHGMHLAGESLSDNEITLIVMAALMHDVGYAQTAGEESGTGAQYTQSHVQRGIDFMQRYLLARNFPSDFAVPLEPMIRSTDPGYPFEQIVFPNERARLLAQAVATADMVGQMADRTYLEKLLFLFLEFKEANFGNYRSKYDLLRQTKKFYEITLAKLNSSYRGLYTRLALHFKDAMGAEENYYLQSIEKNIAYLDKITARDEAEYLSMLKRGGIVERSRNLPYPE
ncbi:MAG: HD domain-containing protein [Nitrosomonadales bacterium]|nr:HD domain-containing protein [Nitrosomonadales bacterium]